MKQLLESLVVSIVRNPPEPVSLSDALGRIVARDVLSMSSMPFQDTCDVNGYAVIASSISQLPISLKKIGKSRPGKVFAGEIGLGEVIEVVAGTPVPPGVDAIISKDEVESDDGVMVVFKDYVNEGQHISTKGIDVAKGEVVFKEGTVLNSRHIALATMLDILWLPVTRAPRIGILTSSTDNLKVEDHRSQNLSVCVAEAISYFVSSHGAAPVLLGHGVELHDSPEEIILFKSNMENALKSVDILLVIGGVENSQENIIFTTLMQKGAELKKQHVSVGSGHHVIIGKKGNMPIIGLPSHYVGFILFARLCLIPVIKKMFGINYETKIYAKLSRDLDECDKKTEYLYGILTRKPSGEIMVSPVSAQDSLMLSVLTKTECMVVVDLSLPLTTGSSVEIIMLGGGTV
jgi:molybdopterin molybdotransferase